MQKRRLMCMVANEEEVPMHDACEYCEEMMKADTATTPPKPFCHARHAGHVCALFIEPHVGSHSSYCIKHQWNGHGST